MLDTTAVSRYHVSLTRKDGETILVDLGSANGTYLDGERSALRDGDMVHLVPAVSGGEA